MADQRAWLDGRLATGLSWPDHSDHFIMQRMYLHYGERPLYGPCYASDLEAPDPLRTQPSDWIFWAYAS